MGKLQKRRVYGLGLAGALLAFFAAAALTDLPSRETSDALFPLISILVQGGVLLVILVGVAALTYRCSNSAVFVGAVLLLAAAAAAYPTFLSDQNKPVIFSPGLFFPVGIAFGGPALVVSIFREVKRRRSTKE